MVSIGQYPHESDLVGHGMALERDIRGGLLVAAIMVERALDLIIATHLNGDNRQDFINTYYQMLSRTEDGASKTSVKWFRDRCKSDSLISGSDQLKKVVAKWQGHLSNKVRFGVLLVEEGYPNLLRKGSESTRLERQLEALVQLRNDIAHTEPGSNVDPGASQRPDRIVFVYYEDGQRKSKPLALVDAQSKEKEWNELFHRLGTMANDIAKSRATSSIPPRGT